MAEFMGCIEAGAVTQALIGTKGDDGSVREINAKCVHFFNADAKTNGNDPVRLK
ncbi:hypothetical protein CEDDRAFT_02112 [Frankia sp. CeD]|nr:hypothetical protein BMG523Draft_02227 [Frankia sp. BMG5.23]KEZ36590.1 hypothetical protein CEDDRAFT_02112 [Frankia sp. CeD]